MARRNGINLLKRTAKALKRRRKHNTWKREQNRLRNRPSGKVKIKSKRQSSRYFRPDAPVPVALPKVFSFIKNPEEVLNFFKRIQRLLKKKTKVLLDFTDVAEITPDVLALMMAKFSNPHFTSGTKAWINKPVDPALDRLLQEAGFYHLLRISGTASDRGLINTKKNTVVDTDIAREARRLTSKKTYGDDRKITPLYRTLIECMANTRKHAARQDDVSETWWLAVYSDPNTQITSFAFCDTGVGIFKSSKIAAFTRIARTLGIVKNSSILQDILDGKVASSTGLHYRGKGLPKIYSDYKVNNIKRLHIAANDVFADFDRGTFIELSDELNGTFLYWEIHP
jgi:hypothetical protein